MYPSKDVIFYSADVHSNDIARSRMEVFKQFLEEKKGTVILSIDGLVDKLLSPALIKESVIEVMTGEVLETKNLGQKLVYMGYKRVDQAESRGQFTIRGGIIDIYPLTEKEMVRIELWGGTK